MTSLKDIAQELGLSVSVVSRALNPNPDANARIAPHTLRLISETAARNIYVWLGKQLGAVKPREDAPEDGFRIID